MFAVDRLTKGQLFEWKGTGGSGSAQQWETAWTPNPGAARGCMSPT